MATRIDPDILADHCVPANLCISPDGRRVVYEVHPRMVRGSDNVKSSLWMADIGSEFSARQLTQATANDRSPKFSPDGKYISFVSDRAEPGKKSAIYLLPLEDGGEAYPLTCKDHEMGIGAYDWKRDSKAVAFVQPIEKSEERKQQIKDKDDANVYDEDVAYGRLHVIDLATKEVKALGPPKENVMAITWNDRGTKIAFTTSKSPQIDDCYTEARLYTVEVETNSFQELFYVRSIIESLSWHDDKLMWIAGYKAGSCTTSHAVHAISANGDGKGSTVVAYGKTDCSQSMKLRNNKLFVYVQRGLADVIELLQGSEIYNEKKTVNDWDAYMQSSEPLLVVAESEVGAPNEVYSFVGGHKVQLSQHGKSLADMKVGKVHLCEYTHEDGTPIDGFYAVPTALQSAFSANKPQPTVLVVRGGPYGRVTNTFDNLFHFTAFVMSLGYLVLCPNYRGGSSHGNDYANAVAYNAAASYQDVVWLVKKGIEEGKIDSDRVGWIGWSQGGYLAYLSAVRDETFHYRAIVAGAGISDCTTMTLTSDLPTFEAALTGPEPWALKDIHDMRARENSAIYYIDKVKTPMLLVHGELDARTPLEQAVGFYRGMKAKNKDVKMVTYPREGHGFPVGFEKKHYVHMLCTIETFLKDRMG